MTTKAQEKTIGKEPKKAKEIPYFAGIGRRKASVAQVRVFEKKAKKKQEQFIVNGISVEKFFPLGEFVRQASRALELTGLLEKVTVTCKVRGGGVRGQSEAIRLGVARALVKMDEGLKPALRSAGLLTRDARKVERKKAGLKKARRAPQWSKR
jgi:small subunit ribosomal protein S9